MTNPDQGPRPGTAESHLATAIGAGLAPFTTDELGDAIGGAATDRYAELVADTEREAATPIVSWWYAQVNAPDILDELISRIGDEAPDAVREAAERAKRGKEVAAQSDVLKELLRDDSPGGGRETYASVVDSIVDEANAARHTELRTWTIEVGDAGFRANTVVVEAARTVEEACEAAIRLANDDPDGWRSVDTASGSYVNAITPGRRRCAWGGDDQQDIPERFTQDFVLLGREPESDPERHRAKSPPRPVWTNGGTTIDLSRVRMLETRTTHVPGELKTAVIWLDTTSPTVLDLDEADRRSLHGAFNALVCAR